MATPFTPHGHRGHLDNGGTASTAPFRRRGAVVLFLQAGDIILNFDSQRTKFGGVFLFEKRKFRLDDREFGAHDG